MKRRHAFALGLIAGGTVGLLVSPAARTTQKLRALEAERPHLLVMTTLSAAHQLAAEQDRDRAYDLCLGGPGWRDHGPDIHAHLTRGTE